MSATMRRHAERGNMMAGRLRSSEYEAAKWVRDMANDFLRERAPASPLTEAAENWLATTRLRAGSVHVCPVEPRFCCDHANCQRAPYREVYFRRGGWAYACRAHFGKLRDAGRLSNWCRAERKDD